MKKTIVQVGLDGFSTSSGELFVVGVLAETVGIAGGEDDFNVHAGETGDHKNQSVRIVNGTNLFKHRIFL